MLYFAPWKKLLVIGLCLLGVLFAAPNIWYDVADDAGQARREIAKLEEIGGTPTTEQLARAEVWPSWAPADVVNLGLDLRGGAHLLVEVNVEDVVAERMQSLRSEAREALRDAGVRKYTKLRASDDDVTVRITNAEDIQDAEAALGGLAPS